MVDFINDIFSYSFTYDIFKSCKTVLIPLIVIFIPTLILTVIASITKNNFKIKLISNSFLLIFSIALGINFIILLTLILQFCIVSIKFGLIEVFDGALSNMVSTLISAIFCIVVLSIMAALVDSNKEK